MKRWEKDTLLTAECNDGTGGVVEEDEDYNEYGEVGDEDYNEYGEVEDEDYNEYGDNFYGFDYSHFSTVWFENLKNND